jgi:hypothetical protein
MPFRQERVASARRCSPITPSPGASSESAKDSTDFANTRVRQFMVVSAARVRSALVGIFEGRRQHGLPDRLPPPPTEWAVPYRKLAKEVALDPDLRTGYLQAAALLDRVLAGRTAGRWDPQAASWK